MRSGHPQQGVPSVATQQRRLPPLLVELAARARAQLAELAAAARARCWRSWRRRARALLAELAARARPLLVACFQKLKHIQLIWEGPHRSAYPAAIATQAVAKQSKHQARARRRRPWQQPAQQGITIL